jgi:hypothetical protein
MRERERRTVESRAAVVPLSLLYWYIQHFLKCGHSCQRQACFGGAGTMRVYAI